MKQLPLAIRIKHEIKSFCECELCDTFLMFCARIRWEKGERPKPNQKKTHKQYLCKWMILSVNSWETRSTAYSATQVSCIHSSYLFFYSHSSECVSWMDFQYGKTSKEDGIGQNNKWAKRTSSNRVKRYNHLSNWHLIYILDCTQRMLSQHWRLLFSRRALFSFPAEEGFLKKSRKMMAKIGIYTFYKYYLYSTFFRFASTSGDLSLSLSLGHDLIIPWFVYAAFRVETFETAKKTIICLHFRTVDGFVCTVVRCYRLAFDLALSHLQNTR